MNLERLRIFTEQEWKAVNREHFQKWKASAPALLKLAREAYCRYSLFQTLVHDDHKPSNHPLLISNSALRDMIEYQGFNVASFAEAMYRFFSDYSLSSTVRSLNTIYCVGDATSDAELFCTSVINMFHCVLTANINDIDMKSLGRQADQVKLIYFPPMMHDQPFKNPMVNRLLTGREMTVLGDDVTYKIPQIKCLVHLKHLPRADQFPTSSRQHLILRFVENGEGAHYMPFELIKYCHNVARLEDSGEYRCGNQYSVLCSSTTADVVCSACAKVGVDVTSSIAD